MKSRFLLIPALLISAIGVIRAQGEMDAYKLSQSDLTGTARSVGMGGAVGALGGDISAISVNPAGIGYFTTSQVVTTLNFQNTKTESVLTNNKMTDKKFKLSFNNLAFVGTFPIDSDVAPLLNFGFSFNRLKNYDRQYKSQGNNVRSIADYMAYRATGDSERNGAITDPANNYYVGDYDNYYPFDHFDWLGIFGYNGMLIEDSPKGSGQFVNNIGGATAFNDLFVREKGYVDTYDFNFGTNIDDVVSVGLTVSVTDIDYRRYTYYSEVFNDANDGFSLENSLKTEGTGWQLAAGVIVKPIPEFRFGLSYHSPTWYNLTDYYDAVMDYKYDDMFEDPVTHQPVRVSGVIDTRYDNNNSRYYDNYVDYKLRTPDKFTFSAAGVVGPVILSADYEFTNYKSNMRLRDGYSNPLYDDVIETDFKGASSIRVGAEIGFTKQLTGRLGYAWKESPIKSNIKSGTDEVLTVGSDSHFVLDDDTHHVTWGLGYRFTKNIFTDIAFVYKTQKADLYSFDTSDKASLKTNTFQGLLTLGFRF